MNNDLAALFSRARRRVVAGAFTNPQPQQPRMTGPARCARKGHRPPNGHGQCTRCGQPSNRVRRNEAWARTEV